MEVLEPRVSLGNTPKSIGVLNIMVYISLYIPLLRGIAGGSLRTYIPTWRGLLTL